MATVGAETAMTARQDSLVKTRHHSFSGSGGISGHRTKMQVDLRQCELSLHPKAAPKNDQGYPENAIEETRQIGNKRAMVCQRDRRIITRKGLFITIHAKLRGAEGKRGLFRTDGINRMSDLPVLPGD
ncbi:uncharacterized protein BO96DRAFT_345320 [Aspergillus niger CBS 101883]|uniref:Uncharacterized protein n=2 Tax=Aspergillus niger TaxID=5061 RepID=A2QP86_ASPNC|nr:uncharacterized protein BO96DRAFT_345320 [Aspergillus niger CBS 101883]XP_059601057.1 hypothetical protein An07g08570 [Aspergillus niger]PYH53422.1 hypothetical protein BO96DRAFT_345320 [Aspergillus niger CBS 101883]CAK39651.1 hypothetical protein An07g08570 [Aspergillus niger]